MSTEAHKKYQRERMKKWRAANPEKVSAISKTHYEKYKDRLLAKNRAWNAANPGYSTQQARKWRAANPEKIKCNSLKRTGFTLALKTQRIEEQQNRCAICAVDFNSLIPEDVHADHCHATGRTRGVLCKVCNTNLGRFKDSIPLLLSAVRYLEKYPS